MKPCNELRVPSDDGTGLIALLFGMFIGLILGMGIGASITYLVMS